MMLHFSLSFFFSFFSPSLPQRMGFPNGASERLLCSGPPCPSSSTRQVGRPLTGVCGCVWVCHAVSPSPPLPRSPFPWSNPRCWARIAGGGEGWVSHTVGKKAVSIIVSKSWAGHTEKSPRFQPPHLLLHP